MPDQDETTVFIRTGTTAGNQENVQKLTDEWKKKGVKIEAGPNKITYITPFRGQRASTYSTTNFQVRIEEEGLMEGWKVGEST
ncbi:hypothetical protein F53441_5736 [Fusarium austroafricanum]|uniref:Uncharacterized protein n=1 Tax=Fusarium austroafricanum TaxID=2364996 RepID=A0A8H4KHC5_9HYPO|nr:hypothetical protein F53441_5736 [Fusarium austroafricanum]